MSVATKLYSRRESSAVIHIHPPKLHGTHSEGHSDLKEEISRREQAFQQSYRQSIDNPSAFWDTHAKSLLDWFVPYKSVLTGTLSSGDMNWFNGGTLNACYNAIDRHAARNPNKTALIWEGDDLGINKTFSFQELGQEVSRIANVMKAEGVKKGDFVTVYMPMIPELVFVMLACARIGAVHSVVFAGLSAVSLRDRMSDSKSRFLFAADIGKRGGKTIQLKSIADVALESIKVDKVFVHRYGGTSEVPMVTGRDIWLDEATKKARPYCPPEHVNAEDPLFILYTSGSTGKPKGVVHSTAGYILSATLSSKIVFDYQPGDDHNHGKGDVMCCPNDLGWITGHTYSVYGPLVNGITTVMFESTPLHPNPYRYWDLIQKYSATQFYCAPTALRSLMRFDTKPIEGYDLTSLRILGTAGEPVRHE